MGVALASLTVHKQADLLAQCAFVALGVAYAVWRFPMPFAARAAAIAGAAGLIALLLLLTWAMRRGTYRPILRRLAAWKPLSARLDRYQRHAEATDGMIRSFSGAHRSRYLGAVALGFLGWCGGMLETYLILRWLSASADWGTAFAVEALAAVEQPLFRSGRVGSGRCARLSSSSGNAGALGVHALVRRGRRQSGYSGILGSHTDPLALARQTPADKSPRLAAEDSGS
jgi:hypothetical protein